MQTISSEKAPAAIGPYAQAVSVNGFLFTSGQIALSPETGALINGGIEAETQQVLLNLSAVLKAGGASVNALVKVVIFLKNMSDFAAVNTLYETWLNGHRPARSTIEVAGLPRGALVEIECIATIK